MADAREIARQIVKTSDDCLIDGADTTTLVSRIEAHVLAYAAERERLLAEADATVAFWCGYGPPSDNIWKWGAEAEARHRARSSSPVQDEGKPPT